MNRKLKESGTFTSHTKLFDADVNRYGRQYAGGKDIENIFNELEHEADRDYAKAVTDEIEKRYSYLDEDIKYDSFGHIIGNPPAREYEDVENYKGVKIKKWVAGGDPEPNVNDPKVYFTAYMNDKIFGNAFDSVDAAKRAIDSYERDKRYAFMEDTIKQGNAWVNKGKEGTHGKFRTKKEADAQRKAMFAQGYKGEALEDDYVQIVDTTSSNYRKPFTKFRIIYNCDEKNADHIDFVKNKEEIFNGEFSELQDRIQELKKRGCYNISAFVISQDSESSNESLKTDWERNRYREADDMIKATVLDALKFLKAEKQMKKIWGMTFDDAIEEVEMGMGNGFEDADSLIDHLKKYEAKDYDERDRILHNLNAAARDYLRAYNYEDDVKNFTEDLHLKKWMSDEERAEMKKFFDAELANAYDVSDLARDLKVNAPSSRGARMPEREEQFINEEDIPDNMRFKSYRFDYDIFDHDLFVEWLTQEPFNAEDAEKFKAEILRAIKFHADKHNLNDINVYFRVKCRDGAEYGSLNDIETVNKTWSF